MEALNEDDKHRIRSIFTMPYVDNDKLRIYGDNSAIYKAKEKEHKSDMILSISKSIFATQPAHLLDRWENFIIAELQIHNYLHLEEDIKKINKSAKNHLLRPATNLSTSIPQNEHNSPNSNISGVKTIWSIFSSRGALENAAGGIWVIVITGIFGLVIAIWGYINTVTIKRIVVSILDDFLY